MSGEPAITSKSAPSSRSFKGNRILKKDDWHRFKR